MILTPSQKLPNNVEWLPKVQKIAQSGHTACGPSLMTATAGLHRVCCLSTVIGNIQRRVAILKFDYLTGACSSTSSCNLSLVRLKVKMLPYLAEGLNQIIH